MIKNAGFHLTAQEVAALLVEALEVRGHVHQTSEWRAAVFKASEVFDGHCYELSRKASSQLVSE